MSSERAAVHPSAFPLQPLLVVDDEPEILASVTSLLRTSHITNVVCCQDSRRVMDLLREQPFGAILLDLSMPGLTGLELLPQIVDTYPDLPVTIFTVANEIETAVACMRAGAFDYMLKPVEQSRLISGIQRAIEIHELRTQNALLSKHLCSDRLDHPEAFSEIVSNNQTMYAIFRYCETVARTLRPVLITGETGTGKEQIARAIHRLSGCPGPFVAVNVAGLDDTVFSDTLFGHVRGAFTGAEEVRRGLIEQAAQGTLFLDEIGDLCGASQVKLLRLIQEHEYFPLGSDAAKRSTARLLVATNQELESLQRSGRFRNDLYYRLQVHQIHMPPLRKRKDDIPLLVDHFLQEAARALNKRKPKPPNELFTLLATYTFPGNIRELEAMVFEALCQHEAHRFSTDVFKARIEINSPPASALTDKPVTDGRSPFVYFDRLPTVSETTTMLIEEAMARAEGNQTVAARLLGMTRTALNKRLNGA